ncbi:hypothetical protein LCGC14_0767870 [marine sediment metagenome]|uniref:Uncharacterized protein n=1 Tax=marine sediment metagenome TaxID=412755 RepID=A0A0F9QJ25_9ZZZZ
MSYQELIKQCEAAWQRLYGSRSRLQVEYSGGKFWIGEIVVDLSGKTKSLPAISTSYTLVGFEKFIGVLQTK